MDKQSREKLLAKTMTRREFLQFAGSSALILVGLSNVAALISHTKKVANDTTQQEVAKASGGFGSRKFGV